MNQNFSTGLSTELYVAHWYAAQGYQVYWPLSTQSRDDFVVCDGFKFLKIQVKKATWSQTGPYRYLQCRLKSRNTLGRMYDDGDFDYVVFVDDDKRLWVAPWDEVRGLVSVCLDGSKDNYRSKSTLYDPSTWRVYGTPLRDIIP